MAATWSSQTTTTARTLTSSFQALQVAAADEIITLDPNQAAHIQIDFNPQATPTDDLEVEFRAATDTNYDTDAFQGFRMDNGTDPGYRSVVISGVYQFKTYVRQTGSTDTTSTALMRYRIATLT